MIKTNEGERVKQQWITVGKPKVISLFDLAKGFPKTSYPFFRAHLFMWSYRAILLPIVGIPKGHDNNICNYISGFLQVFQNNSIENVTYFLRIELLLAGVGSENNLCKRDVCGVDEFIAQFFFLIVFQQRRLDYRLCVLADVCQKLAAKIYNIPYQSVPKIIYFKRGVK